MPLAATHHTPAGATAFAEFFIKTIDWGYATTSSAYMRHYFDDTCRGCTAFAATITKDAAAHDHYVGGRLTVESSMNIPTPRNSRVVVLVDGTAREVVSRAGNFVRGDPAYPSLKFGLTLQWAARSWRVIDLGIVTS